MSTMRLSLITATLVVALTPTTVCWAQAYGFEGIVENNDLSWFEPIELDLDGQIEPQAGFFFRYDKLMQHFGGEKVEIGDPNVLNDSELVYGEVSPVLFQARVDEIFIGNPNVDIDLVEEFLSITFQRNDDGTLFTAPVNVPGDDDTVTVVNVPQIATINNAPPPAYNVTNGILDGTPDAAIGWGERYELGYSDGERGWIVGILDGPEANSGGTFGAGEGGIYRSQTSSDLPGTDPFFVTDLIDADGDGVLDNLGAFNELFALGFGSVAVNFSAPEGFFRGFRDYQINSSPTAGTVTGPIYYVGNYGTIDDNEDFEDGSDTTGIADDLNGNLDTFFLVLSDLDGDGTIDDDEIIGTITDFGDLYEFDVFFDEVTVRNRVELDGIELMLTHEMKMGHRLEQGRRDHLQFRYGVNFLRLRDEFTFQGLGSILGRTTANHEVDNQIVGPQVGLRWTRDRGKWDFTLDGRVTFGYNIADLTQNDIFGEELIPGALNRPALGRTTTTVDSRRFDGFSPLGELRAEFRYKITKALAIKAGYTGQVHRQCPTGVGDGRL